MNRWFKKLRTEVFHLADTKWGAWALLFFAFGDASFFPLPVTTFFLILILVNPQKTFKYSLIAVSGTFVGSLAGYLIGHNLWLNVNGEFTGFSNFMFSVIPGFTADLYSKTGILYEKWGLWILSFAVTTPIPYGVFSVLSGVFETNFFIFSAVTIICQGLKFSVVSFITLKSGTLLKKLPVFKTYSVMQ